MEKFKQILLEKEKSFIVLILILLLLDVVTGVTLRYIRLPLYWTEEAARYLFIWLVMLGCVVGVEEKTHFSIDALYKWFPKNLQRLVSFLGITVAGLFLFVLFYEGVKLCIRDPGVISPALGIPQYFSYLAIPIGAILMLLHLILQAYLDIKEMNKNKTEKI